MLFSLCDFSTRGVPVLAKLLAGGAILLAAACAPVAPAAVVAKLGPGGRIVPPPASAAIEANTELAGLLDSGPELAVAGERLNARLLRRFYAHHGFEPVWTTRQGQADALINAVLHSGEHGLAPQLFHANLLQSPTMPPLQRDMVLSDAFLSYADALARGIVPVERRRDDETLTPEPIDVVTVLDAAITDPDPASAIEALAPTTPTYRLLREALQKFHAGAPVGGKASTASLREIEVNLERERWLPRHLPAERVWVNVADERAELYQDDRSVFSTKVIVGQDVPRNQSPEFQTMISGVWFNPPWNIPQDIATNEILPKISQDPNYLTEHNMVMLPDGTLQQVAGANSGLGQIMLDMRNRFDVYLHDTPSKNLFARDDRRISHGCIRMEKPREMTALLMRQSIEDIDQAIAAGGTTRSNLPQPVPVFIVYETAFADADGRLQFRPDVYGRDTEIWAQLDPERKALADSAPPSRRGG